MAKQFLFAAIAALTVAACTSFVHVDGATCENSKFGENAAKPLTDTCSKALGELNYVSPNLKSCYRNSGLYFSTPDTVCSPNCLQATIEASKKLAEACPVPAAQRNAPQANVYSRWACPKAAAAACAKSNQGKYCLQAIASKLVTAEYIKLGLTRILAGKDLRKELGCDGPCAKPFYDALEGDGKKAPVLYFFGYNGLDSLFSAFEKVCGFKKPAKDTHDDATQTPKSEDSAPDEEDEDTYGQ